VGTAWVDMRGRGYIQRQACVAGMGGKCLVTTCTAAGMRGRHERKANVPWQACVVGMRGRLMYRGRHARVARKTVHLAAPCLREGGHIGKGC
jgi:hypothetical protein